ncbi:MAG: outer membrane protein assembly factor BamE [Pseudomonadota bacterium]
MSALGRWTKRGAAIGAICLTLASCSSIYRNHGYVPAEDQLENIVVGVDTQASVEEIVGRPSSSGVLRDQTWYYVGSRWEHYAYRAPKEVDRQIVAISFDQAGTVSNIERFTLEDGRVIALSRRVTDSNVKGVPFLRQLLGSIGRFNPADLFGGE